MADNTVVAATLRIDADAAIKSTLILKDNISKLKKEIKETTAGSDEQVQAFKKLQDAENELTKAVKSGTDEKNKSGEAFSTLKSKAQDLVPGLKGADGGVTSFGAQLKILAANPIVLVLTGIVLALTFLYEAFAGSVEGGKQLKQVFAAIEAAGTILMDAVLGIGRAIIDVTVAVFKFLTLDFKGAAASFKKAGNEASGAMTEFGKITDGTLKKFAQLEEAQQKNDLARKKSAVVIAETNKLLVQSREILTDENATIEQKRKALGEVTAAETKSSIERVRIATEDLRIIQAKQAAFGIESENAKKLNQTVRELTIAKSEAEQENAQTEVKLNKQKKNLDRQEKTENATADKEAKDKEKERITNLREFTLKDMKAKQELELASITDAKKKELKVIENAYGDEQRATLLSLEQKKISLAQSLILNQNALNIANEKKSAIEKKFKDEKDKKDKDAQDKEKDATMKFDAELNKLELEIRLAGITDVRKKERVQLQISFADKFKQAEETYKNDIDKLGQIRTQLFIQQAAADKALEKKFADEDEKAKESFSLRQIAFQLTIDKRDVSAKIKLIKEKQAIEDAAYKKEIQEANGNAIKLNDINLRKRISDKANTDAIKAYKKEEVDAYIQAADAVANTLSNAAKLLGEATGAGKALAVASAIISTFTSAQKAYESTVGVPIVGPVLAPINAGLAVAAGLANVQKILSVEVPGASGSSGSVPSAPSAPVAPVQKSTSLDAASIQGVGNAAAKGVGQTFILNSQITDTGERLARLTRASRLG